MSDPFYRSKAWHRLRCIVLERDPVCASPGCGQRSVAVDHIIERARGGPDHESNLRGLCTQCHNARRRGREPRATGCDADGTPRDLTHWWNRENLSGLGSADRVRGSDRVSSQKSAEFRQKPGFNEEATQNAPCLNRMAPETD